MDEAAGYAWDVERLAAAITPRTVAIVVNTPVNPTGVVLGEDTLRAIADLAERHDLLIVSDESYDTMVYDGHRHVSCASVAGAASRTAIIRSFTKSFAMPAWRVGYIVGPRGVIDACNKALEWEQLHGNHVAQAGAAAAMRHPVYPGNSMAHEFQQLRDVIDPFVAPGLPLPRREASRGAIRVYQRFGDIRLLRSSIRRLAGRGHPYDSRALLPIRSARAHGIWRVPGSPTRSRAPHCRCRGRQRQPSICSSRAISE